MWLIKENDICRVTSYFIVGVYEKGISKTKPYL